MLIVVTNTRKKLKILAFSVALWLLLFWLGSFIPSNLFQFNITVDSFMEFSYPFDFIVAKIMVKDTHADRGIRAAIAPHRPQTGQFSSFDSLEGHFSFDYPSAFVLKAETFSGGDIVYHIDFFDKKKIVHGFVQVWNLSGDLEQFLETSLDASEKNYKYFNRKSIKVDDATGYLWDYSVETEDGYFKGCEVFLQKEGYMYRLSYFVPEEKWDEKHKEVFVKMVKSFKIK